MGGEPDGVCPLVVERPVMMHRWESLTFLHWSYDVGTVQALLPRGLSVEPYDGRAWVGLIPFHMRVGPPVGLPDGTAGVSSVPWASRFCETNVRTYVVDETGRTGIWFFSLDAARLGAVVTARATYRLPYFWSEMRLGRRGDKVRYSCVRRWPGPRGARSRVHVEVGTAYGPGEATEQDHWLTARWTLFSAQSDGLRYAEAQHDPWPLHRATATQVDDELLRAAGLPQPVDAPLVHWSEGVDVRIGRPHRPFTVRSPAGPLPQGR